MRIVADENIPFVKEAFSSLGEVVCLPGRDLCSDLLVNTEVLLVRSVTSVNARLLEGTPVRFVGTATIGTDHIDQAYLTQRKIAFADAAGSNATSVAEYVTTALLTLAEMYEWNLDKMSLGIIGVGHIGSRVERMAKVLGMDVWPHDPPLQRQTGDDRFVNLTEALEADIVTFHVPLTTEGTDPTYHLLDKAYFSRLRMSTVIINTSRGPVVDNQALKDWLDDIGMGPVVLDVWENEPDIDLELLDQTAIATPHIAGYSLDGKVNGTICLHQALCRFLRVEQPCPLGHLLPAPRPSTIILNSHQMDTQQAICKAFQTIYPIMKDDNQLRPITSQPVNQRAKFFDGLRKNYPVRREASAWKVQINPPDPTLAEKLRLLGFQ